MVTVLTLWLSFGIISLLIIFFFRDQVQRIFPGSIETAFLYFVYIIFIVKLLDYFLIALVRAYQFFAFYNFKRIFESVLFIVLITGSIFFGNKGIFEFLFLYFISSLISLAITFYYILKRNSREEGLYSFKISTLKKLVMFGFKSYIQNLTGFLNFQMSVFILAYFMDNWNVGIFSVAVSLASIVLFVPDTIGTVLLPFLSSKTNDSEIHNSTAAIIRNTLVIILPVILIFSAFGKWLIYYLYGSNYNASYYPMIFILFGMVFLSIYKILTRNFTSRNKQHLTIYVSTISLAINIVLNIFLISVWGIYGAAISSTFSFILVGLLLLSIFKKETGLPFKSILIFKREDIIVFKNILIKFKPNKIQT
jgi:O-antigen/teichoic acid export membrane protein